MTKFFNSARRHAQSMARLAVLLSAITATAAAPKPNFIFINIDDLGYADIEPFGSKLNRTPNLNRMAAEGRKLTCFYAAPVCSPSRAALMTGCYAKRSLPIPHVLFPGNDVGLDPREITVAELLKRQRYVTAIVGKWHLGDQPEFMPTRQGFDSFFRPAILQRHGAGRGRREEQSGRSNSEHQGRRSAAVAVVAQ